MMRMGWHLAEVVRRRGLTATELMRRLAQVDVPLSLAQVSRLMAGSPRRVSLDVLRGLCQVLDCGVPDLLTLQRFSRGHECDEVELPPPVAW